MSKICQLCLLTNLQFFMNLASQRYAIIICKFKTYRITKYKSKSTWNFDINPIGQKCCLSWAIKVLSRVWLSGRLKFSSIRVPLHKAWLPERHSLHILSQNLVFKPFCANSASLRGLQVLDLDHCIETWTLLYSSPWLTFLFEISNTRNQNMIHLFIWTIYWWIQFHVQYMNIQTIVNKVRHYCPRYNFLQ